VWALAIALAMLVVVGGRLGAQSLGEVARQEQERRKTVKVPSKVYTNDDLKRYPTPPPPPTPPQASGSAAKPPEPSAAKTPPAERQEPAKDEAYWRGRITAARSALERNEMFRDALQSRINALSNDFVNRDDPAQRAAIAFDRQKALAEFDRVQGDIQRQTQAIAAIEEEARRAGVPPGWLR
jgi:hypothetical protein